MVLLFSLHFMPMNIFCFFFYLHENLENFKPKKKNYKFTQFHIDIFLIYIEFILYYVECLVRIKKRQIVLVNVRHASMPTLKIHTVILFLLLFFILVFLFVSKKKLQSPYEFHIIYLLNSFFVLLCFAVVLHYL